MIFDLIRLVLVSRSQTSLFEEKLVSGQPFDREKWLRAVLSQDIVFSYRNQIYHYVSQGHGSSGTFIAGKIGRQITAIENDEPSSGFERLERPYWLASLVLFDPRSHEDGQKIAFERKTAVGQSVGIVKALFDQININVDQPYIAEPNGIADPESFWDFEKQNRGKIVAISFELVAPNMFGIRSAMDEEMSELRDGEKVVSAEITLKNPNGLQLETDRVKHTVAYTAEGGGSIKARLKGKRGLGYNSEIRSRKLTY